LNFSGFGSFSFEPFGFMSQRAGGQTMTPPAQLLPSKARNLFPFHLDFTDLLQNICEWLEIPEILDF
jgi:hypothetical protein